MCYWGKNDVSVNLKKIHFVHVFNISLGMGQYSLISPPLSEFFLPTFVSFDSKCNICQSPKLTSSFDPPPPPANWSYIFVSVKSLSKGECVRYRVSISRNLKKTNSIGFLEVAWEKLYWRSTDAQLTGDRVLKYVSAYQKLEFLKKTGFFVQKNLVFLRPIRPCIPPQNCTVIFIWKEQIKESNM